MICLNGKWYTGINRNYTTESNVPGLVYSAMEAVDGTLWYKKDITLPAESFSRASLVLYGAKYQPKVYVNGMLVSSSEGGLTVTRHLLDSRDVKPGNTVTLEIELTSYTDTPDTDASKLPEADDWRSDLTSHIWNDVYLDLHDDVRIDGVVPAYDKDKDALDIRYKLTAFADVDSDIAFTLLDGETIIATAAAKADKKGKITMPLDGKGILWSCENPKLYTLKTEVKGQVRTQKTGLKVFEKDGLGFKLNGQPITLKMATMCWHRWQRDEQAKELSYDENWFLNHVILPLKEIGGNTVRFHLGPVPEKFMDLCDEYGMLIQAEWSFFHGLKASGESLREQWANRFDMALSHVGTVLIHPWNEIPECQQLVDARDALADIMKDYPDFILSHRDVMHLHKYWWSMFENVGIYYDNKEQFGMTVIADEFGGNYLDYEYNPGLYPHLISGFMRFLGKENTAEERIWQQKVSHAKIAEYWRRMGVAGFSPFCMISGPEDGNTYYEGDLRAGKFKPVWNELKCAYAPVTVSMDIWDRNFCPGQKTDVNIHFINDTDKEQKISCTYGVSDAAHGVVTKTLAAFSREIVSVTFEMPENAGEYTMYAKTDAVTSSWDVLVTEIDAVTKRTVGILECETELAAFLDKNGISYTYDFDKADVIVGLEKTYEYLKTEKEAFEIAWKNGKGVALLSVGPKLLGEGYDVDKKKTMQSARIIKATDLESLSLFGDITVFFKELSDPESCVHRTENCPWLWDNMNKKSMWLWNGLRGGLIVPAVDMSVVGTDKESFEKLWQAKGADIDKVKTESLFAYELEGFYEYSEKEDPAVAGKLRQRVKFLVDDAPSLQGAVNPDAKITVTNLSEEYKKLPDNAGKVKYLDVAKAGKMLLRTPSVNVEFADGRGNIFISQMMFDGRLCNNSTGFFDLRNDPAAGQMLVNIIKSI